MYIFFLHKQWWFMDWLEKRPDLWQVFEVHANYLVFHCHSFVLLCVLSVTHKSVQYHSCWAHPPIRSPLLLVLWEMMLHLKFWAVCANGCFFHVLLLNSWPVLLYLLQVKWLSKDTCKHAHDLKMIKIQIRASTEIKKKKIKFSRRLFCFVVVVYQPSSSVFFPIQNDWQQKFHFFNTSCILVHGDPFAMNLKTKKN